MNKIKICEICGVTSETKHVQWSSKINCYLCAKHRWQIYKYGKITDPTAITIIDANEIEIKDDYAEITLRNRKHEIVAKALIDIEDVDKCKNIKWSYCEQTGYAYFKRGKNTPLHRYVLNYYGDMVVDHINRNKLDNRKNNLRIVNYSVNRTNTSKIKGAYYKNRKWETNVTRFGKCFYVGTFSTYEEAIQKREEKIKEIENDINMKDQYEQKIKQKNVGVYKYNDKWRAYIFNKGKSIYIGKFNTEHEAQTARTNAINEMKNYV